MKKQHLAYLGITAALAFSLQACNDDDNNTGPGTGTTSGTTAGTTAGSTSGTTAGTSAGTTSGTTSGTTAGTTSGTVTNSYTLGNNTYGGLSINCTQELSSYQITASSATGGMLELHLSSMPTGTATYVIDSAATNPNSNLAGILLTQPGNNFYFASSGTILASVVGGSVSVSFSNVTMVNAITGAVTTLTGSFSCSGAGTTGGTTSGTTSGTTWGTTAGTTSGSTSGTTTSGTTSGTTWGTTSGTTSGSTTGGTVGTGSFTIGTNTVSNAVVQCASQQGMFALVGASQTGTGVVVYLGGGQPTSNATYQISAFTGAPGPGQANIMATADQTGTNAYMAVTGQVQVTIVGGKVKATFSGVPAMNPFNSTTTILSGSLTCQ